MKKADIDFTLVKACVDDSWVGLEGSYLTA